MPRGKNEVSQQTDPGPLPGHLIQVWPAKCLPRIGRIECNPSQNLLIDFKDWLPLLWLSGRRRAGGGWLFDISNTSICDGWTSQMVKRFIVFFHEVVQPNPLETQHSSEPFLLYSGRWYYVVMRQTDAGQDRRAQGLALSFPSWEIQTVFLCLLYLSSLICPS